MHCNGAAFSLPFIVYSNGLFVVIFVTTIITIYAPGGWNNNRQDGAGNITSVTINVERHREAIMPVLEKLGVIEKSAFDKECETAMSVDELRQSLHNKIYAVWGK